MGSSSSISTSNHDRKSIAAYLEQSPLSVALPAGCIEEFATCFELVELHQNSDLAAAKHFPRRNGDFFVIGEGQIDVSMKVPSSNKKTGYIREVLCSKKQGDILFVPAVENLAGFIHINDADQSIESERHNVAFSNSHTSRIRRTSERLARLLSRRSASVAPPLHLRSNTDGLHPIHQPSNPQRINQSDREFSAQILLFTEALTEEESVVTEDGSMSPKSSLRREKHDQSLDRIEKLMKHLDMTTITAPYGAVLLRLDKSRFDAFEASVAKLCSRDGELDESIIVKDLPWSKHAVDLKVNETSPSINSIPNLKIKLSIPDFELMRVMLSSNIQDYLKRIPFLTKVPASRVQMLGEMSQFEVLRSDQIVCQEGSQGDKVYVVIFGQLAVYIKGGNGTSTTSSPANVGVNTIGKLLGCLEQGDHFGEMSVLADIPRQATVKTKSSCLLISISRANFRNLMKLVPDVGDSVQSVIRLYMLSKFFSSLMYSEVLVSMDIKVLETRLLPTCKLVETPADMKLISEGQDAESFYFVYHGRVVAYQANSTLTINEVDENDEFTLESKVEEPRLHLGMLGPGCYFGEISILTDTPCRATIVTVTKCLLLKVSRQEFQDVWCTVPGFRAEFLVRIHGKACRLDHILNHYLTKNAFSEFLRLEHAVENLDFIDACQDYFNKYEVRTSNENMELAHRFMDLFLDVDAEKQVNVPHTMMTSAKSELDSMASKIDPGKRIAPKNLFEPCRKEIFKMVELGSLARFKKTIAFGNILNKLRAYEQLDLSNIPWSPHDVRGDEQERHQRRVPFAPPPTLDQQRRIISV